MIEQIIHKPWPWYISGPLIGLFVPLLLIIGNRTLGISSSFKHICTAALPVKKIPFFQYNWKEQNWNLFYVAGILLGGFIVSQLTSLNYEVAINPVTKETLKTFGITNFTGLVPVEWFRSFNLKSFILLATGGFLVGFGTRYANGCTSGHAIMGLSLLNFGSLVAVVAFFIGGLIMTHTLYPLFF